MRDWNFSWDDLDKSKEPLLTPESKEEQAPIVDYKDILILKELQQKVPRTLSKLSKTIGLDQHNLRYHYKTHARRAIAGYYLQLIPRNASQYQSTIIFSHELVNEKALNEARNVALAIPFTQRVWKSERNFGWDVSCPGKYVSGLLRYVNGKFAKIPGKLKAMYIDPMTEYVGTIPYTLFDEERGTWKYEPQSALQMLKK